MVDSTLLTRRMKHFNNRLNHFWNRWRSEYLNELREAHYHSTRKSSDRDRPGLSVGEVVIVHDEHLPRGLWKLGVIQDTITGQDGQIRGATVKMAKRDKQQDLLRRPIQLLYPLEFHHSSSRPTETENPEEMSIEISVPELRVPAKDTHSGNSLNAPRRSGRATAQQADERRKACVYQLEDI